MSDVLAQAGHPLDDVFQVRQEVNGHKVDARVLPVVLQWAPRRDYDTGPETDKSGQSRHVLR